MIYQGVPSADAKLYWSIRKTLGATNVKFDPKVIEKVMAPAGFYDVSVTATERTLRGGREAFVVQSVLRVGGHDVTIQDWIKTDDERSMKRLERLYCEIGLRDKFYEGEIDVEDIDGRTLRIEVTLSSDGRYNNVKSYAITEVAPSTDKQDVPF